MADAAASAPVIFKKRAGRANAKKRAATPPSASDSDYSSAEDESGARIKRRRKNGITTSTSSAITKKPAATFAKSTQYTGDRTAAITNLDDATKTSNWFHADEAAKAAVDGEEVEKDGTYKGAKGYGNFIQKNPDKLGKSVGPVKAPTNMRMITLVDFAPDVCKDYKQTGFCGFGDSCKFLHAREDYKQGWQLDKEWEKAGKSKAPLKSTVVGSANRGITENAADDSDNDEEAKELEKIPFACIICKEPYKSPVVTKCGHYFCEACALKRHKSKGGKQCANCGADTGGTFNVAKNLRKLLDKKRDRIRKRKEKARENGEEVSSDEE